jgi:DNA polymerase III subunit delta
MQLAAAQLAPHLQRGLKSLYVLHGDEPLLQLEASDAIRAAARKDGFTERSAHTVAGAHFDWGSVLAAGSAMSLFADKQLLEIRIPSGKPGKEGALALQQIASQARGNDTTLTLIFLPRLDKATKSSAWFVALEGAGISISLEPIERHALPQWLAQRLALQGQRVEAGSAGQHTLQFFADRVEGNLLAAHQEIQKLALLYPTEGPGATLTLAQLERAVGNVARYDVFKLSEAVLAGQSQRVQRMLEGLQAEGESEVLVHYALSEDIRALKRSKDALLQGRPLPVVLREQRIWGAREKLFERVLPRLTTASLTELLQAAHTVDGIVKGLKHSDWPQQSWHALHRLAWQLSKQCAASPHTRDAGYL